MLWFGVASDTPPGEGIIGRRGSWLKLPERNADSFRGLAYSSINRDTGNRMLELPTFEELRDFVHRTLCARAELDLSTPLLEAPLYRRGKVCGAEFTLLGARSCRLSAIWETIEGRILFYDQLLQRFQVSLVRGPQPEEVLQQPRQEFAVRSIWKGRG